GIDERVWRALAGHHQDPLLAVDDADRARELIDQPLEEHLMLAQVRLDLTALGDVLEGGHDGKHVPRLVPNRGRVGDDDALDPVTSHDDHLLVTHRLAGPKRPREWPLVRTERLAVRPGRLTDGV